LGGKKVNGHVPEPVIPLCGTKGFGAPKKSEHTLFILPFTFGTIGKLVEGT
jgi:hypothetical protein